MKRALGIAPLILLVGSFLVAQPYRVSLSENIPPAVIDANSGYLPDLIREINALSSSPQFKVIGAFPSTRSIKNIETGEADLHMPLLQDPRIPAESLPYAFSTAAINTVYFVLYTKSTETRISPANIATFNVYCSTGNSAFFPGVKGELPTASGMQRLVNGNIEGFIGAQGPSEAAVNDLKARDSLKKQLQSAFDSKAIVPKGEKGRAIDKAFSSALTILAKNGKLRKIYPQVDFFEYP